MDGYALRAADGSLNARLRVIGAAPAGHPFAGVVGPGEAIRLFTGSLVPEGADAILLQEDATSEGGTVIVNEAVVARRHIRPTGQDFRAGDILLAKGHRLGARDVGLAAAGNHPWLSVHRRPVVGILATGDEIALPGEAISAGGIVSSNAHALAALVRARGGTPLVLPIAADDTAAIAAVADALRGIDILITTGGASVGDHDLVQAALGQRGFAVDFWKIAMRPGKPLMFGALDGVPVLGLPGNPVSALVCAILFLIPALDRMSGLPGEALPTVAARLGTAVPANDHRADHLRAQAVAGPDGTLLVSPFARQDSGMLRALAQSDVLVLRAPHAPAAEIGEPVEVIRLDAPGL
jgi:molybdopterin molybdotransferase